MKIQLHDVSNWQIYALQARGARRGRLALPLEIVNSSNITFANLFIYRVISMFSAVPYAIEIADSKNIKFETYTLIAQQSVIRHDGPDRTYDVEIRQREIRVARCFCA